MRTNTDLQVNNVKIIEKKFLHKQKSEEEREKTKNKQIQFYSQKLSNILLYDSVDILSDNMFVHLMMISETIR